MRIAFYSPFKSRNHQRISGDVTIARDVYRYFEERGHEIQEVSTFSGEWIYRRPGLWPRAAMEMAGAKKLAKKFDCWLSYQTYYRAPDLLGPCFRNAGAGRKPYFIFSGTYASRRRRSLKTWAGYQLNRRALLAADHIFSNKREKHEGVKRLVDAAKCSYVRPGIRTAMFAPSPERGKMLRKRLCGNAKSVVVTAAMFRPGVKTEGVAWVIRACGLLRSQGCSIGLLVAGDGPGRQELEALAGSELPGRVFFLGVLEQSELSAVYSAGDVFAFPGVNENLGMVYLEAQCCGLPVVAFDCDGAGEVVVNGKTGIITPAGSLQAFAGEIGKLLGDAALRGAMSRAARAYVVRKHDIFNEYEIMEKIMLEKVHAYA